MLRGNSVLETLTRERQDKHLQNQKKTGKKTPIVVGVLVVIKVMELLSNAKR